MRFPYLSEEAIPFNPKEITGERLAEYVNKMQQRLPEEGKKGTALGRDGKPVCEAEVVSIKSSKAFDKTNLLTMRVTKEYAMQARFIKFA